MKEIKAIVLAARKGSKLKTDNDLPKSMQMIHGRHLMQLAVSHLYSCRFNSTEIVAVVNHNAQRIAEFFEGDLQYFFQNPLDGNAGAVKQVSESPISFFDLLVIQGDDSIQASIENIQGLLNFHTARKADLTVLTTRIPDISTHKYQFSLNSANRVTGYAKPL